MILNIIENIRSTASTNEKLEILKENKDNELLKKVCYLTYNPLINYYTKHQVVESRQHEAVAEGEEMSLDMALIMLNSLINREVTGNDAIDFLNNDIASELHYRDRKVLNLIINRDLDCGVGAKSINKVWKDLIPSMPYMRCSLIDKINRIEYPALVQQKADGLFVNVVVKGGDIKFFTRNGTEFELNRIKNALKLIKLGDYVLHGELLVYGSDERELSRKVGNGLINSLIKKNQTIETLEQKIGSDISSSKRSKIKTEISQKLKEYEETDYNLKLVLWDSVPYEDWIKGEFNTQYSIRFHGMEKLIEYGKIMSDEFKTIKLIETKEVNSIEEAKEFYEEQILNGYEGAVLKNKSGYWKNHTSPNQIKMKSEKECELKVIGYEHGTGKYEHGIGSLICESSDGRLLTRVGSGLSDNDRGFQRREDGDFSKALSLLDNFDCNRYTNSIITVKYNEVIESESKDTYSLFLPRFVEIRSDKTEADDLETIKKI